MSQVHLADIWLRDPFIVVIRNSKTARGDGEGYYLVFGTTDRPPCKEEAYSCYPATGLQCYESVTLQGPWIGPRYAFLPSRDFWSKTQYWAPEVTKYGSSYYLTASFGCAPKSRACQILRSSSPEGPYEAFAPPITPSRWICLDGHLYFGETDPIIVFCREWVEVTDGEMYYARLSSDLSGFVGEPIKMFSASEAPWTVPISASKKNYVTDGPFLWRSRASKDLLMLWSSFSSCGYSVGVSRSVSGSIDGPWTHDLEPIFKEDGGHCMLFRPLAKCEPIWDGLGPAPLIMSLHRPNHNPMLSRACFYLVNEFVVDGRCVLQIDLTKFIS